MLTFSSRLTLFTGACALAAALGSTGCSSETGGTGGGTPGGPVSGPEDAHCGTKVQPTSPAACMGGGSGGSGAGGSGGSTSGTGGSHTHEEEPETLFNSEGDDDDCKYHVKFSSTDVYRDTDVTFTVTVTNKTDNTPTTGAAPDIEAFLDETHPAPNTNQSSSEKPAGTYEVGPVQFDAAGQWTVRFHFFDDCNDLSEESPHSHVAFFVDVP